MIFRQGVREQDEIIELYHRIAEELGIDFDIVRNIINETFISVSNDIKKYDINDSTKHTTKQINGFGKFVPNIQGITRFKNKLSKKYNKKYEDLQVKEVSEFTKYGFSKPKRIRKKHPIRNNRYRKRVQLQEFIHWGD